MSSHPNLKLITIFKQNGKFLVWSADDVYTLRTKHRICGALIGSLVRKPWQSSICSLPLVLLPEEVYMCVKHDIARILDSDMYFSKRKVTHELVASQNQFTKQLEMEQIQIFKAEKLKKANTFYGHNKKQWKKSKNKEANEVCEDDRVNEYDDKHSVNINIQVEHTEHRSIGNLEADEKKAQQISDKSQITTDDQEYSLVGSKGSSVVREENTVQRKEGSKSSKTASSLSVAKEDFDYFKHSLRIHIPTAVTSKNFENFDKYDFIKEYATKINNNKMEVFEEFWQQGYYITSAEKFGGNFLVYPNDPLRYHSFYIVVVVDNNKTFTAKDMICYGRLSASVKKTVVLTSVSPNNEVKYLSLNWAHMKVT